MPSKSDEPVVGAAAGTEPDAIIMADRDGIIREWNPGAWRIFGHTAAEAIGRKLDLIIPEEERGDHWHAFHRVMATGILNYSPDHVLDIEGMRKDGARVVLDVTLAAVRDDSGRITGITAILRD